VSKHTHRIPSNVSRAQHMGIRRHRVLVQSSPKSERCHSAMRASFVPRRHLDPGVVVLADVGFAEGLGRKCRPVVITAVHGRTVSAIPCTSSLSANRTTDVVIEDLASAGLGRATRARTDREIRLDFSSLFTMLGRLSTADAARLLPSAQRDLMEGCQ
jgi:hypothetical protein